MTDFCILYPLSSADVIHSWAGSLLLAEEVDLEVYDCCFCQTTRS